MEESHISLKKKRIRTFFANLSVHIKEKESKEEIQEEIAKKGLSYVQMRLPISKITPEFENKLREKVDKNILHAKIREATEDDLESVMYIYNRAWMTANTPFAPIDLESLKYIYNYPETKILIARVYGTDAGFIILDFEGKNLEYGIIAGLGILPRFQRKGLGTVLGMAAWDYFKKKNVKELRCEVYKDNLHSYNFIKSLGFEEFDTKIYKMEDFHL
ncbi:MAG: GNAT family N-acetyltransferase [Promethearchaeia archaeon]